MAANVSTTQDRRDVEKTANEETDHIDMPNLKEIEDTDDLDPVAVKKLLFKVDCHVVPPLFILFLLAFLDRSNIGNANIQGLSESLHLSGVQYNIALFIFFIPYILLEVPSNIVIKKVAPSTWLSLIMVLWGKFFILYIMQIKSNDYRHRNYMSGCSDKLFSSCRIAFLAWCI